MTSSLKQLFKAPYNKKHLFFALYRFFLWKVIRALRLRNVNFKIWGDRKIYLSYDSVQSAWIMYNYWIDWEEFHAIKAFIRPGDVVFDVGSNIGSYVLWFSRFTGKAGSVHAFEPDPATFSRLSENIALNDLAATVKAHKKGISDKNGELKFSLGLDIQNQILKDSDTQFQIIPCITLDHYISDFQIHKIRYLKIDIEGFEYQALLGAHDTLEKGLVDIIQLEINEKISNLDIDPKQIIDFSENLGYFLCSYDFNKNSFVKINYKTERENYFLVHNSLL